MHYKTLSFWYSVSHILLSTDIDECYPESPCHANASCTNTHGSFTCACNAGYTGDGMKCYGRCLIRFSFNVAGVCRYYNIQELR